MDYRFIASLIVVFIALGAGGCELLWRGSTRKSNKHYQEVLMPRQTGSLLQRRMYVSRGPEQKKKSTKKETKAPKPEAEPSPTPTPEEESTPPPDRFR
jgi:hypothetical protein